VDASLAVSALRVSPESIATPAEQAVLHAGWQLTRCEEPLVANLCLLRVLRAAMCSCALAPAVAHSSSDPTAWHRNNNTLVCGTADAGSLEAFTGAGASSALNDLLPLVADSRKTVVLTGLLGNYGDFLLSFACQLRKLGVHNLLVAAFDEEALRVAQLYGLPAFLEPVAVPPGACHFGTPCFRTATKAKSRAALRVLQAGHDVLYSDSDVVWFSDPVSELRALSEAGGDALLVQSNEPNATLPANGARRINSGFYFARSSPATVSAVRAIVAHAGGTKLSEQPSFYDVLCGASGEFRAGNDSCQLPDGGVRTLFLDRDHYPNGVHRDLWAQPDVGAAALALGSRVLHNNWVVGGSIKLRRQRAFWHFDGERGMCAHDWAAEGG
jgi:hypothetical protein